MGDVKENQKMYPNFVLNGSLYCPIGWENGFSWKVPLHHQKKCEIHKNEKKLKWNERFEHTPSIHELTNRDHHHVELCLQSIVWQLQQKELLLLIWLELLESWNIFHKEYVGLSLSCRLSVLLPFHSFLLFCSFLEEKEGLVFLSNETNLCFIIECNKCMQYLWKRHKITKERCSLIWLRKTKSNFGNPFSQSMFFLFRTHQPISASLLFDLKHNRSTNISLVDLFNWLDKMFYFLTDQKFGDCFFEL